MDRAVTIKDVAELAGVSVATASRVLSANPKTSQASRKAVKAAAARLRYTPNALARSLRIARSHSVGLLVSDIRNPYFSELAHAVQTALFEHGYSMFLGNASEQDVLQDQYLSALQQQRIDGLIATPQGNGSELLTRLAQGGLPMVFVDRTLEVLNVPFVNSDPAPGISSALDQIHSFGHRRVGFVAGPQNSSTGVERVKVFQAESAARFDTALVRLGGYDPQLCAVAVEELLAEGCTALVFGYSPNAVSALQIVRNRGLRIPKDLSLVSFDERALFEVSQPAISHISQGVVEMGRLAVQMLFDVIQGGVPASRRLPTQFCARESVGPVPRGVS